MMTKTKLYPKLKEVISELDISEIADERKQILQVLISYIQEKRNKRFPIRLNFICTHNSRRSHLSQIWAQTMANAFGIEHVHCYSGGTEATAMYPMVAQTLVNSGFEVLNLSEGKNPVYGIKFGENGHPIIGYSKTFDDPFNPQSDFAAVMTCSHADENCPLITGAERRVALTYEDPKAYDGTPQQEAKYDERSRQIATEMKYVFSKITE